MQWKHEVNEVVELLTQINEKPLELETLTCPQGKIVLAMLRDRPANTELTYATVGLSVMKLKSDSQPDVGAIELVAPSFAEDVAYKKVIENVIQTIVETGSVQNQIFLNVMEPFYPDLQMKHIFLMSPYFWEYFWDDDGEVLHVNGQQVRWLQVTPISEAEYRYGEENGYDELENLLVSKDADTPEINRDSLV